MFFGRGKIKTKRNKGKTENQHKRGGPRWPGAMTLGVI